MTALLLLHIAFCYSVNAQQPIPTSSINSADQVMALQQQLDGLYSVRGGTIAGNMYASSGSMVFNNSGNGIIFGDGTKQTSAAGALSGNNTWTGTNTFNSSSTFNGFFAVATASAAFTGTVVIAAGSGATDSNGLAVIATSIDGVSQSSGCVVVLRMSNNSPTPTLQFTSSITASNAPVGVLKDTCAPGAICRVQTWGPARIILDNAGDASGQRIDMSTTRCQGTNSNAAPASTSFARSMSASTGAGSWQWIMLGYQ